MNDKIHPLFKGHIDGRNPLSGQINLLSMKTPKASTFIDNQPQTLNKVKADIFI
jgi:hypothetical protein